MTYQKLISDDYRLVVSLMALILISGCGFSERRAQPDVIWIVWDAARSDRMSLYGHHCETTPFLDNWAREGLVFENCLSVASASTDAHASMFTNLLPSGHGAGKHHESLDNDLLTLPEIFQQNGYQSALYSENPSISRESGFAQGFDVIWHPWDNEYREQLAIALVQKMPLGKRTPRLMLQLNAADAPVEAFTDAGDLGRRLLKKWLSLRDRSRPVFVFMNYMEAHLPITTPERFRLRTMTRAQVDQSYQVNANRMDAWRYCFGFADYTEDEKEIIRATYDAALMELDELLQKLVETLTETGMADNTIIVLSSDHGEHLCEHHLLDHQYSLYQELLRVPLVIHYPSVIKPGRELRPVANMDIFPTLLELAGITYSDSLPTQAVSLLAPLSERVRLSEYPKPDQSPVDDMLAQESSWNPIDFRQGRRSIQMEPYKLIVNDDSPPELYHIQNDSLESDDISADDPARVAAMSEMLNRILSQQRALRNQPTPDEVLSIQQREAMRSLGYQSGKKKPAKTGSEK